MNTAFEGSGRVGRLLALLLCSVIGAGAAQAQGFARDSAPLGAQALVGPAVVYLREGGTIRGTLLADNGPNGVRIRSQKSGATFVVPAANIDSVVRGPFDASASPEPKTVSAPVQAPTPVPARNSGAAVALTLSAVRPAPATSKAPPPADVAMSTPPPAAPTTISLAAAPAPVPVKPQASATPVPTRVAESTPASPPAAPAPVVAKPQAVAIPAPTPVAAPTTTLPPATSAPEPAPAASTTLQAGLDVPPTTIEIPAADVALPAAAPDTLPSAPDTAAVISSISFISGTEIYISSGRMDGLVEGSEVEVIRGDSAVATLRVKFLASHKSNTELVKGTPELALGDTVRFHRHVATEQIAIGAPIATPRPRRLSGQGLHGRIGSRYLRATTSTVSAGQPAGSNGFNQPSLDARLYGLAIGGTPLGVAIDLRARQTTTSSAGGTTVDGHTRAYQAVLYWNAPDAKFRVAAGRQYLMYISSIGLFDGGLVELNGQHLSFGAFGGWEPDAATLQYSSAVHDFGAYLTMHNAPGGLTSSAFTIGAVGSYEGSTERREWGIAQATVSNRYLSLYLLQEIDYYRPWKLEGPNAESSAVSFTSQFANVSARPKPWLSINATYDKRRTVRLIRDFTNPETNFDDAYREGYGGGLQYSGRRFYLGGDWRRSTGATVLGANSYTATLGANRIAPLGLGLSVRATWYQNQNDSSAINPGSVQTNGHLYSGHVNFDPTNAVHVDLNGGVRQEDNPAFVERQKSTWYGVDLDVALARQWYLNLSGLRQKDPANPGTSQLTQIYSGLTWRF
ncbi:MAG: hypothetical protein R2910_01710 [Gemmatimonadales bacterium]